MDRITAAEDRALFKTLHPRLAVNILILNGWLILWTGSKASVNQMWTISSYSAWREKDYPDGAGFTPEGHSMSPAAGTA